MSNLSKLAVALSAVLFVGLISVLLSGVEVEFEPLYEVRDLSNLGEIQTRVHSFQGTERFVGEGQSANGKKAFRWTKETGYSELGTLGGASSTANCLGPEGAVVGTSRNQEQFNRAFIWNASDGMHDLGTLGGDHSHGLVWAVDGVTGRAETEATGTYHAFHWTPEEGMKDLGTLGGKDSQSLVGNTRGNIVGWSHAPGSFKTRAVLWDATGAIHELPGLGGEQSQAICINDHNETVGFASTGPDRDRACYWTPDRKAQPLEGLAESVRSRALGLNLKGQKVGWAEGGQAGFFDVLENLHPRFRGPKIGTTFAVLWEEGTARDLNDLISPETGWKLAEAWGIDSEGIILGLGFRKEDPKPRTFLLVPR